MPVQLALFAPPAPARGEVSARRSRLSSASCDAQGGLQALSPLSQLERDAERYVQQAHAQRTREAYQHDWAAFDAWCATKDLRSMPATTHTLELYLTHLAQLGRKASTIRRARIAIGLAHGHAGAERPDKHARIRALERGIGRVHGAHEESAIPLLEHELAQVVATLRNSPRDERDRALLLLGFAAALRRSELAGLNVPDVTFTNTGLELRIRRSKEDQLGRGAVTEVPFGKSPETCPVRALQRWMQRVGRPAGPLFRVVRGHVIEHERMHPKAACRAVQRAVERAGLELKYSAHSLRAGLATSAWANGSSERDIQRHGRWLHLGSVGRYIHPERAPGRRNVADGLL